MPQMSKCPTFSACDYTGRAAVIGAFQTVNLSSRDTNIPTPSDSPIANIYYYWSLQVRMSGSVVQSRNQKGVGVVHLRTQKHVFRR